MDEQIQFEFDMTSSDYLSFLLTTPMENLVSWANYVHRRPDEFELFKEQLSERVLSLTKQRLKEVEAHLKETPTPIPKVIMSDKPKPSIEPTLPPTKNKGEQNLAEKLQKATWEIERLRDDNKELKDQVSRYKNAEIARDQHIKNLEFDLSKLARDVDKYRNKTYNLTKKLMKMPGSELPDFDV